MSHRDQLFALVRSIPIGFVSSYSDLGKALPSYASGLVIGRWMAACPGDLPWWRVVAKDGSLPVRKRSPLLGMEQEERLRSEGVEFENGCVIMDRFTYHPTTLDW